MSGTIIENLRYISENFAEIEGKILLFVFIVYVIYGVLIGVDASKRYRSPLAPIIAFICWFLFSLVFLPIYLIVRPEYGAAEGLSQQKEKQAVLFSTGLDECPNCKEVVERFYQYCRHCGIKLLKNCPDCDKGLPVNWEHCVYCGKNFDKESLAEPKQLPKPEAPTEEKHEAIKTAEEILTE
jgi:hypothetical protein